MHLQIDCCLSSLIYLLHPVKAKEQIRNTVAGVLS